MTETSIIYPGAPTSSYCSAMNYAGNTFEVGGFAIAMSSSPVFGASTIFAGRLIRIVDNVVCRGSGLLDAVWSSPKELALDLAQVIVVWGHWRTSKIIYNKASHINAVVQTDLDPLVKPYNRFTTCLERMKMTNLKSFAGGTNNFFKLDLIKKLHKKIKPLEELLINIPQLLSYYNSIVTSFAAGFVTSAKFKYQGEATQLRFENLFNDTLKLAKAQDLNPGINATLADLAFLTNNQIFNRISKLLLLASNISQRLANLMVDPNLDIEEEFNQYEEELRLQFGIKGHIEERPNILLGCDDNFLVENTTSPLEDLMQVTQSITKNFHPGGFGGLQANFNLQRKSGLLQNSFFKIYTFAKEVSLLKVNNESLINIQEARHLYKKLMNEIVELTSLNLEYYKASGE